MLLQKTTEDRWHLPRQLQHNCKMDPRAKWWGMMSVQLLQRMATGNDPYPYHNRCPKLCIRKSCHTATLQWCNGCKLKIVLVPHVACMTCASFRWFFTVKCLAWMQELELRGGERVSRLPLCVRTVCESTKFKGRFNWKRHCASSSSTTLGSSHQKDPNICQTTTTRRSQSSQTSQGSFQQWTQWKKKNLLLHLTF